MHLWGDPGVDWDGIDDAAEYIGENLRKWGRVNVTQYKEKYGMVRVYCYLGLGDLHQLTHPGYCYNQWPEWAWRAQFTCPAKFLVNFLNFFFFPYHKWLYRFLYKRALERANAPHGKILFPHLREEILACADYGELLQRF